MAFTPTKLPSGRWRGGFTAPSGKRILQTHDTEWEAREWSLAAEARSRELVSPTRATPAAVPAAQPEPAPELTGPTVAAHGEDWLLTKRRKAKATVDGYRGHLRSIAASELGSALLGSLTRADVEEWMSRQLDAGTGAPSVNARLRVLRMICRHGQAEGLVRVDPCHGVEFIPEAIRDDRTLSSDEEDRIRAVATDREWVMVLLGTDAGLRSQEMLGLPASAVVGDYIRVRQVLERSTGTIRPYTKGHKQGRPPRTVPMTARLAEALQPFIDACDEADPTALLFTNRVGKPQDYYGWRRSTWRPLLRRAKVSPIRYHDLRHTFGSRLGADPRVSREQIKVLMGHSDIEITARYIHAGEDGERLRLLRKALEGKPAQKRARRAARHLEAV